MRAVLLFFLITFFNSCFLFKDFKRTRFSFSENGKEIPFEVVVPKKYNKTESQTDSVGNQVQYYYYSDGTALYFALMKDTSAELQSINYDLNVPKPLYHTVYFKGLDSTNHYWRETRFDKYRAGYKLVDEGEDGNFDSSINYFSLHIKR
jgi:hypothetical protein